MAPSSNHPVTINKEKAGPEYAVLAVATKFTPHRPADTRSTVHKIAVTFASPVLFVHSAINYPRTHAQLVAEILPPIAVTIRRYSRGTGPRTDQIVK